MIDGQILTGFKNKYKVYYSKKKYVPRKDVVYGITLLYSCLVLAYMNIFRLEVNTFNRKCKQLYYCHDVDYYITYECILALNLGKVIHNKKMDSIIIMLLLIL